MQCIAFIYFWNLMQRQTCYWNIYKNFVYFLLRSFVQYILFIFLRFFPEPHESNMIYIFMTFFNEICIQISTFILLGFFRPLILFSLSFSLVCYNFNHKIYLPRGKIDFRSLTRDLIDATLEICSILIASAYMGMGTHCMPYTIQWCRW